MGLLKADWHITVAGVDTSDPFADVATEDARLDPFEELCLLVRKEADLDCMGIHCPLKDGDWSHPACSICPERGDAERAPLCRLGMEQERVLALC